MTEQLCLMSVHAHPDDEASKGAGTVARYHDEGVHTVLVTCTGGEEGDILNQAMDTPEVRADISAVRRRELDASAAIIGYDEVVLLGYRDSGMAGTESNSNPLAFANAPLAEVTGRLVREIRRTRPQVIITYDEDQSGYPHPDHLRVHEVSVAAFDAAGNRDLFPEAGDPFRPAKLYYSSWPWRQILGLHHRLLELGLESPFNDFAERVGEPPEDTRTTTRIDIRGYEEVRTEALKAHATQINPEGFWFNLPPEVTREFLAYDEYILARGTLGEPVPEDDLFAGLRAGVGAR